MPIQCQIVTQDKLLFEGPADIVIAPGAEGEMGILPNHSPLLTTLDFGVLRVKYEGVEQAFVIAGGFLEVRPDVVTVLADVGERVDEIDEARARAARERAEELLKKGPPADKDEFLAIESALRRSKLRLEGARRYGRVRQRPRMAESDEES
ncbi:MAG: ATP synthase F1 subunit epsilon [Chloroflexi bacterium RBG_16_48_8]|nr:MAG: ATP synthase F1 subunit epsilon [Chloroflexi bacterium RBG_16_48_8]